MWLRESRLKRRKLGRAGASRRRMTLTRAEQDIGPAKQKKKGGSRQLGTLAGKRKTNQMPKQKEGEKGESARNTRDEHLSRGKKIGCPKISKSLFRKINYRKNRGAPKNTATDCVPPKRRLLGGLEEQGIGGGGRFSTELPKELLKKKVPLRTRQDKKIEHIGEATEGNPSYYENRARPV